MIKLKTDLFEGNYPLTQAFGLNFNWYAPFGLKGHNGIDYGLPVGTKLFSAITGTVTEVALDARGYGNYIKIENDECGILYGHMRELSPLKVGSNVKAGDLIGYSGNTGNSTGPHLHFGLFPKPRNRNNGYAGYINPLDKKLVNWVKVYDEEQEPCDHTKCNKELEEMRNSRNEWKDKATKAEDKLKKIQEVLNAK